MIATSVVFLFEILCRLVTSIETLDLFDYNCNYYTKQSFRFWDLNHISEYLDHLS